MTILINLMRKYGVSSVKLIKTGTKDCSYEFLHAEFAAVLEKVRPNFAEKSINLRNVSAFFR